MLSMEYSNTKVNLYSNHCICFLVLCVSLSSTSLELNIYYLSRLLNPPVNIHIGGIPADVTDEKVGTKCMTYESRQ